MYYITMCTRTHRRTGGRGHACVHVCGIQGIFVMHDEGGDHALELHEFLECLVMLAFHRANPRFGEVGREREAAHPLPGCLEQMLQKHLLKRATQDGLAKVKKMIEKSMDIKAHAARMTHGA